MVHLRKLTIGSTEGGDEKYPFNVPAIDNISSIEFFSPVTIFIGENGSGKSSLLEGIAMAVGSIVIGREEISRDETMKSIEPLAKAMKLVWNKPTHKGFFLRAEDFFGFLQRIRSIKQDMMDEISRVDREYAERSEYAKRLAKGPATASLDSLAQKYGADLDANSHGETFLTIFQSRFVPGGLYILDEPEAALSPLRQMGLISLIKEMVSLDSQFILATHSPILMAIPGAMILDLDQNPPMNRTYEEIEQVHLYRTFLENPEAFIRRL